MDPSTLFWIGAAVAALVFLDLLFVEVRRAVREGRRVMQRLEGYAELPIVSMLATSEGDVERIVRAVDAIAPLLERGARAVALLRSYLPNGTSPD